MRKKKSFSLIRLVFIIVKFLATFPFILGWRLLNHVEESEVEVQKPRKSCANCGGRHIDKVGRIVKADYEGVTTVHEDYEWTFQVPAVAYTCITFKQWLGLSILLSIFFTPFAGPGMAYAVKILYDGRIDHAITKKVIDLWYDQKFCFKCGVTWQESA
jgi:hypothetical protein